MEKCLITGTDFQTLMDLIVESSAKHINKKGNKMGVIIGGDSLTVIQRDSALSELFATLTDAADVVLACRVSPKQKAEIVQMARKQHPKDITLAIGDGANDVNMIIAAHLGVGIQGLEGKQATRSSDFAIGQFRFMQTLLFYHGRENYRRNSIITDMLFYKNFIYIMP